jgi:hypothetical protein
MNGTLPRMVLSLQEMSFHSQNERFGGSVLTIVNIGGRQKSLIVAMGRDVHNVPRRIKESYSNLYVNYLLGMK